MYLVFVVVVWITIGAIVVDWKKWRNYYPTISFYWATNLLYEFLYFNHSLWMFRAITTKDLNHTIMLLAFLFIIIPIAISAYLQHFPRKNISAIVYVLVWTIFFWLIELMFYKKGMFVYYNGWNILHSLWFDLLMFIMFRLHYKKPLITLGLSAISVILFIILFPIPFESLK